MPINEMDSSLPMAEDPIAESQLDPGRLLAITNRLQNSLSIEDTLRGFSDEVKQTLPHQSLRYRLKTGNGYYGMSFATDRPARFRIKFQLVLNNVNLGSLEFSRATKFNDQDKLEAENLTYALLYPLRNALLYRAALNAAHKDALTRIGNRAAFDEVLDREIELASRYGRTLGLIMIDIDRFKTVNDTYGHATGDCLLKTLANTANNTIRSSDQLFRYGGEEFVVICPETTALGVKRLAERIRRNIEALDTMCEGKHVRMTASFGVAIHKPNEDEDSFFRRADKALYQAKSEGRNCTRVAD